MLPFSPELRYQLVACPSHLTMRGKFVVFYVFIINPRRLPAPLPRTKTSKLRPGRTAHRRMPQQAQHSPSLLYCAARIPRLPIFSAPSTMVWTNYVTRLKSVLLLLPYLPLSITAKPVFVAQCSHGNDRKSNVIGIDKDDET